MKERSNFIKTIMENDLKSGKHKEIVTRFPPEPNGYMHIGHARGIIVNFELAAAFNGRTNLRFDDTNPIKEETKYVQGMLEDIAWLGYTPTKVTYASDYFEENYQRAVLLIKKGLAYVCDLSQEELRAHRGDFNTLGTDSPYRQRSVEENLRLFEAMKNGKINEGEKVLRAKIDMKSPNMNMRDPILYRVLFAHHHRTGDAWCIYPMYDYAHPLQDAIEGITHSLCSLEFEDHRPLYDWVVEHCEMESIPRQIEFGRLNIANTIMSKRYLRQIVEEGYVTGWNDPRMPTLRGLKRRGIKPKAIRDFILDAGLSRINSTIGIDMLDHVVRDELKLETTRPMAVINPLKVTITNYPEDHIEYLDAALNSENPDLGERKIAFSRHLYIEKDDFIEEKPNKHWKRLAKGIEVRLYHAYFIHCHEVVKNQQGDVIEILCTYDKATRSGSGFSERKPNGTIHFVEADTALNATFRIIEPLIEGEASKDTFIKSLNKDSMIIQKGFVENYLIDTQCGERYQFPRLGYFTTDDDSTKENLIFNRIVSLKSSFKPSQF